MRSAISIVALLMGFAGSAAQAHPGFTEKVVAPGAYQILALRVTHGCDGRATTGVKIQIPEGVMVAKPRPIGGWTMNVETVKLDKPMVHHGVTATEVVRSVSWSGGNLPDNAIELFEIYVMTPHEANARVDFPMVQVCGDTQRNWTDIAPAGADPMKVSLPNRAPFIWLKDHEGPHGG